MDRYVLLLEEQPVKLTASQVEDILELLPGMTADEVIKVLLLLPRPIHPEVWIAFEERIGEPSAKLRQRLLEDGARWLLRFLAGQ